MNLRSMSTVALAALALVAAGCGDDEDDEESASGGDTTAAATVQTAPPSTTPEPEPPAAEAPKLSDDVLDVGTDTSSKPDVPTPEGDPPSELVVDDIVKGKGAAARPGDLINMHYVGVLHKNGEQFDASWDSGQTIPFQLGAAQVIPGWDQGIVGMRAGGRRVLIIPPELAYGDAGQGEIGPGETLVFVVDLVKLN